ncbi:SemiSWEET family transporter [Bavariicoccus seileri]|uniref:SemiSWEET family transporter n=1 Tax=Bavariicoccus seileri TaxID=549685 RepID=UPI003F93D428
MDEIKISQEKLTKLGWVATATSFLMYIAYIPQIINNVNGDPGSSIQPLVAAINCSLWAFYGIHKKKRDWPLVIANAPGIVLGLITFITAINQ